jgi:hypothetical protein
MAITVKHWEVRFGELEDWCINKYICTKRKKNVMKFKKSELEKAKKFAQDNNSKVEIVWGF